ncbi:MAG TPA: radical SAM protein, partial [Hyphomicrobiales bacterium]|nr:radical SAM protein [Hyphomicrobiales bacterium]
MAGAIKKYLSLQVPRYTSYPTAPHFSAAIDAGRYRTWLEALDPAQKLSLYLHIPFCRRLCWYCGCNMRLVARYDPIAAYVQTLIREIELLARSLPEAMSVAHVHWGGGTPNCLSEDYFLRVNEALRRHFNLQAEAEIAVELDPRILTANRARALSRIGCTRASLGVQELDPKVQAAINRIQPLSTIEKPVELLRGHSIGKFNFDLMYGLPHQTSQTLKCTIHELARLEP